MKFIEFISLQFKFYVLLFSSLICTYMSSYNKLYLIGVLISVSLFIMLIQQLDKEFILLESILAATKKNANKSKIRLNMFKIVEIKHLIAHLNDIILFHQKTIKKAHFYNHSKKEKDKLATTIHLDEMTGLFKRNKFIEEVEKAFRKCILTHEPELFIAFLDIDKFKNVNDNYGHDVGDEVLIQFSESIRGHISEMRKNEQAIACRWGGEEFVVMYFGMTKKDIEILLEKFRVDIETSSFPKVEKMTVSIGYSQINLNNEKESLDSLIKRADEGVYLSKQNGRNRITFIK